MNDLISRQAAIDFVGSMNMCDEISNEAYKKLTSYLDELPPAEQDTTTHDSISAETGKNDGDRTSGDCISRQQAIDAVGNMLRRKFGIGGDLAEITIAGLPSAQPEIIRCKDCKYYREYGYVNGKPKFLPKCTFNSIYVNVDDFCSKAERKKNGQ